MNNILNMKEYENKNVILISADRAYKYVPIVKMVLVQTP